MTKRIIIPYNPKLKLLARHLRNNSTKSEICLWQYLKNKQMFGFDFHRQKPLGDFIIDFFCHELMLAIELDGYTHMWDETIEKDQKKEDWLNSIGICVMRFSDAEVFDDIDNVLRCIEVYIVNWNEKRKTHP